MIEKIKVKVSSFVANILENDALRFGFLKNSKSNKNALLNKLIPTLVEMRKAKRDEIEKILKNEYNRKDSETIYNAVNMVIDRVYFSDTELDNLEEYIWIRPSKNNYEVFDEIQVSEVILTAQEISVYIRGLLNEYSRFPQYKREMIVFDKEMDIFSDACVNHNIMYFRDKETFTRYKVFAYNYFYGYLYEQTVYCVCYDICGKKIFSMPVYKMENMYTIKEKYIPSEKLLEKIDAYCEDWRFDEVIIVEE